MASRGDITAKVSKEKLVNCFVSSHKSVIMPSTVRINASKSSIRRFVLDLFVLSAHECVQRTHMVSS